MEPTKGIDEQIDLVTILGCFCACRHFEKRAALVARAEAANDDEINLVAFQCFFKELQ